MQEGRKARQAEADVLVILMGDELRRSICLQIILRPGFGPTISGRPERRSKIRYQVSLGSVFLGVNSIVLVLQVPVAEQRHHNAQPVEFARALQRIVFPFPVSHLPAFDRVLQACLVEMVRGSNVTLSALQLCRQSLHVQVLEQVVVVGEVAGRPHQASGDRFRLRFDAELRLPPLARGVLHVQLRVMPAFVFFYELHRRLRHATLSAGTVR